MVQNNIIIIIFGSNRSKQGEIKKNTKITVILIVRGLRVLLFYGLVMYMANKASLLDVNMLTVGHLGYFRNHHFHMVLNVFFYPTNAI